MDKSKTKKAFIEYINNLPAGNFVRENAGIISGAAIWEAAIEWILSLQVQFSDTSEDIEARLQFELENSCPHCGGSGHKDDVRAAESGPLAYTGSGSLDAIKVGAEGHLWGAPSDAHPIPLYAAPQPAEPPNEHGKNRYGLDMAYFRNLFNRELNRPLTDFRPDELARVLARAARTADAAVLREPEFNQPTQVPHLTDEMRRAGVEAIMDPESPSDADELMDFLYEAMLSSAPQAQKKEGVVSNEKIKELAMKAGFKVALLPNGEIKLDPVTAKFANLLLSQSREGES